MGYHDRDPSDTNPYGPQTVANTGAPWLGTGQKVDVDLEGLREYAGHMATAQRDLMSRAGHLMHLSKMPIDAWDGKTLGEAAWTRSQMLANAGELTSYLTVLEQTLFNIGCAAQTIADIYGSADGASAADLNDVLFAFGDQSVGRPEGLPKHLGQTYFDALAADNGQADVPADSAKWGPPVQTIISPYQTMQTSTTPNGQRREITTTSVPSSGMTITTTTVYAKDGTVLSSRSTRAMSSYDTGKHASTTTTESFDGTKKTGTTTVTTQYEGTEEVKKTTESKNTDGKVTGGSEESTDTTTGEQTSTTYRIDEHGNRVVTDKVVVGSETESEDSPPTPIALQYDPTVPH